MNRVVGAASYGTNYAPAISKADVGIAAGNTGTDIVKKAADIIIENDNFNSIVHAIISGRNFIDRIRCYLQFALTFEITSLLFVAVGAVFLKISPLEVVYLLWSKFIFEFSASLAYSLQSSLSLKEEFQQEQ